MTTQTASIFLEKLKLLHSVSMELARCRTLEDLYRDTVVLGREHLGFDRLALLLLEGGAMVGTYGTDEEGNLRDERYYRQEEISDEIMAILNSRERANIWMNHPLYDNGKPVGRGWNIMAALWDGDKSVGWLATDNFIRHEPLQDYHSELLVLYARVVAHLITRKHNEIALQESEALFKGVFDNASDAILLTNTEGHILRINPSGEVLFHLSPKLRPEQRLRDWDTIIRLHQSGLKTGEITLHREDRSEFPAAISIASMMLNGVACYIVTIKDMTQRQLANQAIKERELFRLELEKQRELNDLKSRFVSMVSHEFRTPLAGIKVAASNLLKYWDRMEVQHREDRLATISKQVDHMTYLIENALLLGKYEHGSVPFNPTKFNLCHFVDKLITQFRGLSETKHRFKFSHTPELATTEITADENLFTQVLTNLLTNAMKYSPAESTIYIEMSRLADEAVQIIISDEGIGIPAHDHDHLFTPFYRATNVGTIPGTGLGLAIVKRAVERHRGTIKVVSTPNQGTRFVITMPINQPSGKSADALGDVS
ncbi:MAG: hypothetical protein OHK0023_08760 [Anaerolineae bacterium]